jgi:lysozyme
MGAVLTPLEYNIYMDEGFRSSAYKDSVKKKKTIGIGFTHGPAMKYSNMSEEVALNLLRTYYLPLAKQDAIKYVGPKVFNKLDTNRQNTLINMAYNMGGEGLKGFTNTREAILAGDWNKASAEILDSDYAKQLPARARRNALRMKTATTKDW